MRGGRERRASRRRVVDRMCVGRGDSCGVLAVFFLVCFLRGCVRVVVGLEDGKGVGGKTDSAEDGRGEYGREVWMRNKTTHLNSPPYPKQTRQYQHLQINRIRLRDPPYWVQQRRGYMREK